MSSADKTVYSAIPWTDRVNADPIKDLRAMLQTLSGAPVVCMGVETYKHFAQSRRWRELAEVPDDVPYTPEHSHIEEVIGAKILRVTRMRDGEIAIHGGTVLMQVMA